MAAPTFNEVKAFIALDLMPKRLNTSGSSWISTEKFRKFVSNFELGDEGILYLLNNNSKVQILEDEKEKNSAIEIAHGSQHLNCNDMFDIIQTKYFWNGMMDDIINWMSTCKSCEEKKRTLLSNQYSVRLDHAYVCNAEATFSNVETVKKTEMLALKSQIPKPTSFTSDELSVNAMPNENCTYDTNSPIDLSTWDHDYIADKLTLRRKLHAFLNENNDESDKSVDSISAPYQVSESSLARLALKDTKWKPVEFSVNYHTSLLANPDDTTFLALCGLEQVVDTLKRDEISSSNFSSVLSCFVCNSCGIDFSPMWHKTDDNEVLCETCHKQIAAHANETQSRQNYIDYHNRYCIAFSRLRNDSIKYAERRAAVRMSVQKKKQEALLHFSKMRKLAMFKANIVTKTLLKQKGIKSISIPSRKMFTQRIRRNKIEANQSSSRSVKPASSDVIRALQRKEELQRYLESKLSQQQYELKKKRLRNFDAHNFLSRATVGARLLTKRDIQHKRYVMEMQGKQSKSHDERRNLNPAKCGYIYRPVEPSTPSFKKRVLVPVDLYSQSSKFEVRDDKKLITKPLNLRTLSKQKV